MTERAPSRATQPVGRHGAPDGVFQDGASAGGLVPSESGMAVGVGLIGRDRIQGFAAGFCCSQVLTL